MQLFPEKLFFLPFNNQKFPVKRLKFWQKIILQKSQLLVELFLCQLVVYLQFVPTERRKMKSKISNSSLETQKMGEEFAKSLKGGSVVALYGELGAGKTTFAQGVARGLGIKNRIISPTFIIIRKYTMSKGSISNFYHVDLYRVESGIGLENLGLDEILNDEDSIVVIEWAEKLGSKLPKNRIDIYFETIDRDARQIIWK